MLSWVQSVKSNCGGSLGEWMFSLARNISSESGTKSPSQEIQNKANINEIEALPSLDPFVYKMHSVKKIFSRYENNLDDLVLARTPMSAQRKWKTPSEFPCCPQENKSDPIKAYAEKLVTGEVFSRNQFSTSLIIESVLADTNQSILVMCQKAESGEIKPWTLAKVTYEDGLYVHESLGSFFDGAGAKKHFCLELGIEWKGGDTFDDFC